MSEEGGRTVKRMLRNLKQVFFKPLSEEEQKKQDEVFDDKIMQYLEQNPHIYGNVRDFRKR